MKLCWMHIWLLNFPLWVLAQSPSRIVQQIDNGCVNYIADSEGNYLPDYSYAGYKYGEVELPILPVVMTISPVDGDNTMHIQNALDSLAAMPVDSNGYRGALLLAPGIYEVAGIISIRESGMVLRGSGQGADNSENSIIIGVGEEARSLIQLGYADGVNNSWHRRIENSETQITNPFVPAGSRTLEVENISLYDIGDNIIVYHPSTDAWLESINYGDTDVDEPWSPGTIDILFSRTVVDMNATENKLILDVPIYDHLDRDLSQPVVYKYDRSSIKNHLAVENIRVHIETTSELDEAHARTAIQLLGVEDAWVKDVTALHFAFAGVDVHVANRVTIENCTAIEPHSEVTGGRRYNFATGRLSNNILFKNCHGNKGRHTFVSNGASQSAGIVFYNCTSDNDLSTSEGHRRWSTGMLFDNITFTNPQTSRVIGLYNRGRFGTGHGWSAGHSTLWNVTVMDNEGIMVQKPPGRQNYAIGCTGNFSVNPPFPNHPDGYIELANTIPEIESLYELQLNSRRGNKRVPDAPAQLNASITNTNEILLEWLDIASMEMGYIIEYRIDDNEPFKQLVSLAANTTQYVLSSDSTITSTYEFRITAEGSDCNSPYSNPITLDILTSMQALHAFSLNIYPNPVVDGFNIDDAKLGMQLSVYDNQGRLVMAEILSQQNHINTTDWSSGTYILKIQDKPNKPIIKKIIVE